MPKWLEMLYKAGGLASLAYYLILGLGTRFGLSASWLWLVFGVLLLGSGLSGSVRLPDAVRWLWRLGLILGAVGLCALLGMVISGMHAVPPKGLDAVIVLGARVNPDGPSPALTHRIDAAAGYLKENPEAICIASGGKGTDEKVTEASCIQQELIKRGIAEDRILLDETSLNTAQNIANSKKLLPEGAATVIVTNNYHVFRALRLAKRAGYTNVHALAAEYGKSTLPHYMVREAFAILAERLRGNL